VSVDDKDVKEAVDDLRMRYATFETCEGKAKDGDQVIIDFMGTVDGEQFPGGSAENYPYILGTKRFFPEFETALKDAKRGDEKNCTVILPEDSPNEALRGKKAEFVINVKEVKRREMPKLDANFAKQVGAESVAALKDRLKKQLQENSAQHSDRIARARALDKVIEGSTYEIPKSLVADVARGIFEDRVRNLIQSRVPVDQITAQTETLRSQSNEEAVLEIKRMVTLNEIGEAEGIEVTDEDFENMAEDIASRTGLQADVVSQYMAEEGRRRNMYEDRIFREKAIRVVMDNAKITDKEVPREELEEAAEEQEEE
jgi:trigger factor